MALRLHRLKMFWDEMMLYMLYTERVIIIIQRAWHSHKFNRLKCIHMVAKMVSYCKHLDLKKINPPKTIPCTNMPIYVELTSPPPKKRVKLPKKIKTIYFEF